MLLWFSRFCFTQVMQCFKRRGESVCWSNTKSLVHLCGTEMCVSESNWSIEYQIKDFLYSCFGSTVLFTWRIHFDTEDKENSRIKKKKKNNTPQCHLIFLKLKNVLMLACVCLPLRLLKGHDPPPFFPSWLRVFALWDYNIFYVVQFVFLPPPPPFPAPPLSGQGLLSRNNLWLVLSSAHTYYLINYHDWLDDVHNTHEL